MTSEKKTAPVAATTETAHENIPNGSRNDSTPSYLYLEDHGKSTGVDYVALSGNRLPRSNTLSVLIPLGVAQRMYQGDVLPTTLDPACVEEYEERFQAERRRKEEHERFLEQKRAREEHELDVIERITGERISKEEIEYRLVELYRDGTDVTPWLEALKVLDDEALAAAGVSSWDEVYEDE